MDSSDRWLSIHVGAAESVATGGRSSAFGQGLQQTQEQHKPKKTILTLSPKDSFLLSPETIVPTQQGGDVGHCMVRGLCSGWGTS